MTYNIIIIIYSVYKVEYRERTAPKRLLLIPNPDPFHFLDPDRRKIIENTHQKINQAKIT